MKQLTEIADKYRTDKGTIEGECHSFTNFYDDILKDKRNEQLNILEIGVWNGSSINMWSEYFPNSNVYGIDININRSNEKIINNNAQVFLCDGTNEEQINDFLNKIGNPKFDIIIDDGSHQFNHQMKSLLIFMNHLTDNGIYILEDLHSSISYGAQNDSPMNFICFNNKPSYITDEEYKLLNDKISTIKMFINFNKFGLSEFKNRSITSIITFNNNE